MLQKRFFLVIIKYRDRKILYFYTIQIHTIKYLHFTL